MGILRTVLRALTWWHNGTLNTQIYTWRKGVKVGEDAQGNVYYQSRDAKRRWVMFNGDVEASRIAPEWHGWLHHTFKDSPVAAPLAQKSWQAPHQVNLSGSALAHAPAGSLRRATPVDRTDYQAWKPE